MRHLRACDIGSISEEGLGMWIALYNYKRDQQRQKARVLTGKSVQTWGGSLRYLLYRIDFGVSLELKFMRRGRLCDPECMT